MAEFDDGYDGYYANRLWQLLPGVYRAQDALAAEADGPLQELVNRVGTQIAVVRRSIDRLWADQSIETCDDWVIPYIGDLLDTNLLANLDAAAQRLDVAKTIHYRRRKGTVAILEEIARDVTGWDAHVVEAFRTLGRTRHGLDPPVGVTGVAVANGSTTSAQATDASGGPWSLLEHEGLVGTLTATPAGGFAGLRSAHGATLAGSPFDELAHTADLRAGRGAIGHYSIGKLLVFVWRLVALPVSGATPVAVTGCPGMYTFDPTGRQIPLFMRQQLPEDDDGPDFADTWTPALETEVPGPLSDSLAAAITAAQASVAAAPAPPTSTAGPTTTTSAPTSTEGPTTSAPTSTPPAAALSITRSVAIAPGRPIVSAPIGELTTTAHPATTPAATTTPHVAVAPPVVRPIGPIAPIGLTTASGATAPAPATTAPATTLPAATTPPAATTAPSGPAGPGPAAAGDTTPAPEGATEPPTTAPADTTPPPTTAGPGATTAPPTSTPEPPTTAPTDTTPPPATTAPTDTTPPPATTAPTDTTPPPATTGPGDTTPPPATTGPGDTTPPPATTGPGDTTPPLTSTTEPPTTAPGDTTPPPATTVAGTTTPPPASTPEGTTEPPTTSPADTTPAPTGTAAPTTTAPAGTTPPATTTAGAGPPPPSVRYPGAAGVPPFASADAGSPLEPVGIRIFPEVGQFSVASPPAAGLVASYLYGFPATIGAGPYDRSLLGDPPVPVGTVTTASGAAAVESALSAAAGNGTVQITDSQTYTSVPDQGSTASPIRSLLVQAGDLRRPVIRLAPPAASTDPTPTWTFTGGGGEAFAEQGLPSLTLDGLLFSGGDIVLRGAFVNVRLTGFTADPGTAAASGQGFATSVDGRSLAPTTVWIEADPQAEAGAPNAIQTLAIDSCLLGPVRTRNGGAVESVAISDSIVQGLAPPLQPSYELASGDVYDPALLVTVLRSQWPPAKELFDLLAAAAQSAITSATAGPVDATALTAILAGLNALVSGSARLDVAAPAVTTVPIDPLLASALALPATGDVAAVNRALLQAVLPVALAPAALAFEAGSTTLERVTVMGSTFTHQLAASDSVLADLVVVDDAQSGCLRYSAVASGSFTPRQFSCVSVTPDAPLFTSADFGQPGYGQLLETADRAIATAGNGLSISAGAENGSEMGAYCSGLAPIKENGLRVKYDEYMPLGLTPVIVHVT